MLKQSLAANAVFSAASAAVLLIAGDWLGRQIPAPGWLWPVLGAGLVLFALQLVAMTRSGTLAAKLTPQVVVADIGWIVLTLGAMLFIRDGITGVGVMVIVTVNAVVGLLAWLQYSGWKREYGASAAA